MRRLAFLLQLLLVLFLISCGDESAGTISETDLGVLGHIVDTNGVPSPSVEVIAMALGDDQQSIPIDTTTTNGEGRYNFDALPTGRYRIEGRKTVDTTTLVALTDEFAYDSLLYVADFFYAGRDTLFAPGAIQGVVQLEGASSALGVDVFIPGTSFDGKCDAGGNFILTGIPEANNYTLAVMAAGYTTDTSLNSLTIAKNDTLILTDTIKLFYDANQIPPAPTGVIASYNSSTNEVTITWDAVLHPNWKGFVVYRKDSSLTASEPLVISGTQLVTTTQFIDTVSSSQQITYQYHVKSQDSSENRSAFSLPAYVSIKAAEESRMFGVLVTPDGAVQGNVQVVLFKKDEINNSFDWVDTVKTDARGQYQMSGFSSGTYYLNCMKEVSGTMYFYTSLPFDVDSLTLVETPLDLGVDTIDVGGIVQGKVTLEGASDHSSVICTLTGPLTYPVSCNSEGSFEISNVNRGTYSFKASHKGYIEKTVDNISVVGDTVIVVNVELLKDGTQTLPDSVVLTTDISDLQSADTAVGFIWNNVDGETYVLQLATDEAFTTSLKTIENITPHYLVTDLLYGVTYYARVNATNGIGETKGKVISFKTTDPPLTRPVMAQVRYGTITDSDGRSGMVATFDIMIHEVTVEMYRMYKPTYMNLLGTSKAKHPVISVGWGDAIRYANWLSIQNGLDTCYTLVPDKFKRTDWKDPKSEHCKWPGDTLFYEFNQEANGYRLPTSDEWQRAAGGGDSLFDYATADNTIDSTKAWNDSWDTPSEVMQFAPNPLGLYDMSCNAWEMVWGEMSRSPEGRVNYAAPADSANQHGVKMGDGFYGGEGKYAEKVTKRVEWYYTYGYYYECGFRLARNAE